MVDKIVIKTEDDGSNLRFNDDDAGDKGECKDVYTFTIKQEPLNDYEDNAQINGGIIVNEVDPYNTSLSCSKFFKSEYKETHIVSSSCDEQGSRDDTLYSNTTLLNQSTQSDTDNIVTSRRSYLLPCNRCKFCGDQFSEKISLKFHLQQVHASEKRFQCDYCDHIFITNSDLQRHLYLHIIEKSYNHKTSSDSCSLMNKLQSHSLPMAKGRHQCNFCIKSFFIKQHLTAHLKTHTGEKSFRCDICNKTFTQKNVLIAHYRTHSGEKAYQCHICYKSFTTNGNLKNHLPSHWRETVLMSFLQ